MKQLIHHAHIHRIEKAVTLPCAKPQAMLTFHTVRTEYTFNLTNEQARELRDWLNQKFNANNDQADQQAT